MTWKNPQGSPALMEAPSQYECAMDGAKVNKTEGWREIRGVVMAKRQAVKVRSSVRGQKKRKLRIPVDESRS